MNVHLKHQATSALHPEYNASLTSRLLNRYQYFQAPLSERRVALFGVDSLLVILSLLGAFLIWQYVAAGSFEPHAIRERWYMFPAILGGYWVLAWLNDLYDIPSASDRMVSTLRIFMVGILGLVLYLGVFFLIPNTLPRLFFLYFLIMVLPAIMVWRWTYAVLSKVLPFQHRVLILGQGVWAPSMPNILKKAEKLNYRILGYVADKAGLKPSAETDGNLPIWEQSADLLTLIKQLRVHEIVVAAEHNLDKALFNSLVECQAKGVRISSMSSLYEKLYRKIPVECIDLTWAFNAMQDRPVFSRLQLAPKRILDIILGGLGFIILLPAVPLIALAIKLDSPGPIFYQQTRSGRAGKPFSIIKFRTMTVNAEQAGKPQWATKNDVRITRVGLLMRKTRLDELPQVVNIIRGEMSIVGPRPERPEFVKELEQKIPFYRTRLMVKPGLTGWAQTNYNYGNSVDDALIKLQYDFYYLRHGSLLLDLFIVFQTIAVVLKFKGT